MKAKLQELLRDYESKQIKLLKLKRNFEIARIDSKKAIALLRRDNFEEGKNLILNAEKILKDVKEDVEKYPHISQSHFYKEATEEYAEAKFFYCFLKNEDYIFPEAIYIEAEQKICGVCDFTGEILRKSVSIASEENLELIVRYKEFIESIVNELTQYGLNKQVRSKYDQAERNLKRMEGIIYDIKLMMRKS